MTPIAKDFKLNLNILRQCREQMSLSQDQVAKKVKSIHEIELGKKCPSYKQLDDLSSLYQVPRWVFIADRLPDEYQYTTTPAFRTFKGSTLFEDSKIRKLITRVEQYRDLFIDFRNDLDDPVQCFVQPDLDNINSIDSTASAVREWLSLKNNVHLDFSELKKRLQEKSIFIFLTSKYPGWSHIDTAFRGLAILHEIMPIIIINDSDSKNIQSFTLLHELGHILRKETAIDGELGYSQTEKWCDRFSGEVLMPASDRLWNTLSSCELLNIESLAKKFKVSTYVCLVRLRQLQRIEESDYQSHFDQLNKEYKESREKQKKAQGGPPRNRVKEVKNQFGVSFINTVLTTWHHQEITLHKVVKLLGLKHPQQILDLEKIAYD
jgi:Zn-dependent peptidase ImmA (M78 family)